MDLVTWAAEAKRDLADIVAFYESRSLSYTEALVQQLFDAVAQLEEFPELGRWVPELGLAFCRELIVAGYRVVYLQTEAAMGVAEVDILAIAHSRQDLLKKMQRRS